MANVISGKVLIVDDSSLDRKLLKDLLKDDYQIIEAQDGQSALDLIAKDLPDLILLDIQMPVIDGFEVCRRIKAELANQLIPILFFTSSGDIENKVKGFTSGAVDYITKPFVAAEVKARVHAHLQIKQLQQERLLRLEEEKQSMTEKFKNADQKLKDFTAQLIQTEKMAAIGEITAGVAHELKQPLNVMKIICQSIVKDIEKNRFDLESAKLDLPELINQMNRMAQIIDHMRVFSRRTVGTTIEELNINEAIDSVFVFLGQQLLNHNVAIEKQYAADLPKIKGDPIRLEQVFMNLLTNARQALMSSGKKAMKVEIKTYLSQDQKKVIVDFKDSGPGIPQEIREKIFEAFFTTKEAGEGTGLGLSTAKKIVEEHGGKLEVESSLGEWTNFRVTLPITV